MIYLSCLVALISIASVGFCVGSSFPYFTLVGWLCSFYFSVTVFIREYAISGKKKKEEENVVNETDLSGTSEG